jgi:hypothetical protein
MRSTYNQQKGQYTKLLRHAASVCEQYATLFPVNRALKPLVHFLYFKRKLLRTIAFPSVNHMVNGQALN